MKKHYKIEIYGNYQRLEVKLDKYLARKTEVKTTLDCGELISLKNGSTMILNKRKNSLEILVATTEDYLQRAVNSLSKYVTPEQINFQLV